MAHPFPPIRHRFFDADGNPLSGGKVYTYLAGTATPQSTFTDADEGSENTNPIILDSEGYCDMWLSSGIYKVILKDSSDVTIWERDDVTVPGLGAPGDYERDNFTGDGTDTTFELSLEVNNVNYLQIFIDGVYQHKSTYSVADTTLTFSEAPPNNALIEVIIGRAVDIGTPADLTVTAAKMNSESATSMQPAVATGTAGGVAFRTFMGAILDGTTFSPFSIVNNQGSVADVTGLLFSGASYRSVFVWYQVYRNTTAAGATERVQSGLLVLNFKTVAATWELTEVFRLGEAGVEFSVTAAGQIQYTSDNQTGTAATSQLKALVSAIGA